MKQTLFWHDPAILPRLEAALRAGGVVAGSSDTILGLLADLTLAGFQSLNTLKGRFEKPYLILIADQQKLAHFVSLPLEPQVKRLVDQCWPGPLTIILKAKESLPSFMKAADGTIAVRMPHHEGLQKLLADFDGLFSTSANKTGAPVAMRLEDIEPSILQSVAYVVADKKGQEAAKPSTIIDASGKKLRVLREGAYAIEALEKMIGATIER